MNNAAISHLVHQQSELASDPICAYVYDLTELKRHAIDTLNALPANCQLYYAAKANPDAQILKVLSSIVDGFEAASGGELAWLRKNLPDHNLIFGGPGKLDSELTLAIENNIEAIHVESLFEIKRLQRLCSQRNTQIDVLLRMNIPLGDINTTKLAMGGKPTPFGIEHYQLPDALALLEQSPNLRLKGFHFHLMSHQLDVESHLQLMSLYFDTFTLWCQQYNLDINHLNVGGGIGANYQNPDNPFDWVLFCNKLGQLITDKNMNTVQIRFECGRYISASCGYYCMEVLDIKHAYGEHFVVAKGGTHHFRTPAAQNHDHPFSVLKRKAKLASQVPQLKNAQATIVGQLCTPKDILASKQHIDALEVGDYIIFHLAGAYAWNISHQNFLMHEKPIILYLTE